MKKLYLDDIRTPIDETWDIVRSYNEFVDYITTNGIPDLISFDHDLAVEHMNDYYDYQANGINVINYDTFTEKTGMDCAKWLVDYCIDNNVELKQVTVHSANPAGSENILGLINNYNKHIGTEPNAYRTFWPIIHIQ